MASQHFQPEAGSTPALNPEETTMATTPAPSGPINQHKAMAMGRKPNQPLPNPGPKTPC